MLLKQTKIVASISDRRCDVDFIKELFDEKCDFVISKENILIEEDFIKAAKLLKDSRQRADTAKWRNIK